MCVYASNCAHICMSDTFSSRVFACDLAYKLWSVSDSFWEPLLPNPVEASACNMLVLHLATVTLRYVPFYASPASELSPPMAAAPALLCNLTPSAQAFICFQRVPFGAKRQCRSYGACLVWLTLLHSLSLHGSPATPGRSPGGLLCSGLAWIIPSITSSSLSTELPAYLVRISRRPHHTTESFLFPLKK